MLVPILSAPKEPQTLQLDRSPALSNVVRISQVGTRIKLEVLITNRCDFRTGVSLFWFALYLFYMIPESTQEDIAQRTRERHERARKSPGA